MTKYTIYKAFQKEFPAEIWKIVVDTLREEIAVEIRDPTTTKPSFFMFDFHGNIRLENKLIEEKEWTLEALQHQTLILKRVGDNQPIKEGIWLLDDQGETRYLSHEYTWVDTAVDFIKIRHRSIQNGFEEYLDIAAAKKSLPPHTEVVPTTPPIKMPIPYSGKVPPYLNSENWIDMPWVSRLDDKWLWTYHEKQADRYRLNLCVTDTSNVLYESTLLQDMPKMIPQPYFQIGKQIFLMSYNKREIVSYLV